MLEAHERVGAMSAQPQTVSETVSEAGREPLLKPGTRTCLCRACGEHFSAPTTFDEHRVGPWADRRCQTARQMFDSGLRQNPKGIWYRPRYAELEVAA